jgi:hypothetical protein
LNNNRNNNRRRGRNNRGQGGGSQGNRIDSRARGNAPQLLEKYKKLAHDASLNGDRVQTEYYLQFADHYFRVIADNRSQKDDQRPRRDDRDQDDDRYDDNEFEADSNRRDPQRRDERYSDDNEDVRRGAEGEEASQEDDDNPFTRETSPRGEDRARKPRANGRGARRARTATRNRPRSTPPACRRRSARATSPTKIPPRKRDRGSAPAARAQPAMTRRSKRSADPFADGSTPRRLLG